MCSNTLSTALPGQATPIEAIPPLMIIREYRAVCGLAAAEVFQSSGPNYHVYQRNQHQQGDGHGGQAGKTASKLNNDTACHNDKAHQVLWIQRQPSSGEYQIRPEQWE